MSRTVTLRLDPETARIMRELMRRTKNSKSRTIKEALKAQWESVMRDNGPSAWEVYSRLKIPPAAGPKRDRARHISRLLTEKLLAKRRAGTL